MRQECLLLKVKGAPQQERVLKVFHGIIQYCAKVRDHPSFNLQSNLQAIKYKFIFQHQEAEKTCLTENDTKISPTKCNNIISLTTFILFRRLAFSFSKKVQSQKLVFCFSRSEGCETHAMMLRSGFWDAQSIVLFPFLSEGFSDSCTSFQTHSIELSSHTVT